MYNLFKYTVFLKIILEIYDWNYLYKCTEQIEFIIEIFENSSFKTVHFIVERRIVTDKKINILTFNTTKFYKNIFFAKLFLF